MAFILFNFNGNSSLIFISAESIIAGHEGSIFIPTSVPSASTPGKKRKAAEQLCDICAKTFTTDTGLHNHRAMEHDNNPRYKCGVCEKPFMIKSHLESHQMQHLNVRKSPEWIIKYNVWMYSSIYEWRTCNCYSTNYGKSLQTQHVISPVDTSPSLLKWWKSGVNWWHWCTMSPVDTRFSPISFHYKTCRSFI